MYWVLFIVAFLSGAFSYWVYCLIISDPSDQDAEIADMLDRIEDAETFVIHARKKTEEVARKIEGAASAMNELAVDVRKAARS